MNGEREIWYELHDVRSANCVGAYRDLGAALADVRDNLARNGRDNALAPALGQRAGDEFAGIAEGDALLTLAAAAEPVLR